MKKFILAVMAVSCLCSCSKSGSNSGDPDVPEDPGVRIPISISMSCWTKVSDDDYENGDQVGIYVVNYTGDTPGNLYQSGNYVDNMRFVNEVVEWTPDEEIYWKDKDTKADFYCYYPYIQGVDVNSCSFAVQSDQNTIENYKKSEFLWGKATEVSPTESAVPIITNRCMSSMLIYVEPGKGFTEESLSASDIKVEICNTKISAAIDLSTGKATAQGDVQTISPYWTGDCFRAMVVPQEITEGTNLINVYVDGVKYSLATGATFRPNVRHKFTVTVNKTSGGIDIGIGGWEEDGEDNGGSAE